MIWKRIVRKPLHLNKERVWAVFSISTQGVIHLKSAALATKDDSDYDDHDHDGDVNFCLNLTITRWRSSLFPTCFCVAARSNASSYVFRWRWFKELANSLQLKRVGSESLVLFLEWWLEVYTSILRAAFVWFWLHTFGVYHLWHGEEGSSN